MRYKIKVTADGLWSVTRGAELVFEGSLSECRSYIATIPGTDDL